MNIIASVIEIFAEIFMGNIHGISAKYLSTYIQKQIFTFSIRTNSTRWGNQITRINAKKFVTMIRLCQINNKKALIELRF